MCAHNESTAPITDLCQNTVIKLADHGASKPLPFMIFVDSCGFSLSVAQAVNQAVDHRNDEQSQ